MPGYSQYTISSLVAEIADLIDDPTFIQWKYAEIRYGVIEALRWWGALTGYWRARGSFSAVSGTPWYDLSVQIPNLRPRTVTFNDIAQEMDYHLFEQPGGVSGTGLSGQFSNSSILQSIARARNRLVMDAGLPLTVNSLQAISGVVDGRFYVDESYAYLRHGYWKDAVSGAWSPMRPTDAWSQDAYSPLWTLNTGIPNAFSVSVTRPLEVQLYPIPANDGEIEWVSANTVQYDVDEIESDDTLSLPDEFTPAVKYAALSDLLSMDGEGSDPQRADYAEKRYQQFVMVAREHRSAVRVQINNTPIGLSALSNLDSAFPRWRMSSGRPYNAGCDLDLIALAPVANSGFGVTCDVLQSAPIPASDTTQFLQIGREVIPVIIDYVQHYLSFKLAGTEFITSIPTYDTFTQEAKARNGIQSNWIKMMGPLYGVPGKENAMQMGQGVGSETVSAGNI